MLVPGFLAEDQMFQALASAAQAIEVGVLMIELFIVPVEIPM